MYVHYKMCEPIFVTLAKDYNNYTNNIATIIKT